MSGIREIEAKNIYKPTNIIINKDLIFGFMIPQILCILYDNDIINKKLVTPTKF